MSIQETEPESHLSNGQTGRLRRRKRLILKLGTGCLALFLLGYAVMAAVEKIQDMTDRAH
jgi:hypothetical protein